MARPAHAWSARSAAALAIAHQIAAKTLRDALFLSHFPVEDLPQVVAASAGLSILVVLLTTRLLARFGPSRVVPALFVLDATVFALAWAALPSMSKLTSVGVYFSVSALGALLVSGFWAAFNESFDPHTAKAEVAKVGVSATVGGILGGILAERTSSVGGPRGTLLALIGLALLGAYLVRRFSAPARRNVTSGVQAIDSDVEASPAPSTPARLAESPLLLRLSLLVMVLAVASTLLDFALKSAAQERFTEPHALVTFFASFYVVVSVLTFAVQSLASPRLLKRAGLGGTLAILPAGMLLSAASAALVFRIGTTALSKALEAALTSSTHRSAYELLFTPLSRARKRKSKLIIDVLLQRLGDALGGGIVLGLGLLLVEPAQALLWVVAAVSALALWLVRAVHRAYVTELVNSLERNLVKVEMNDALDATTRRAVETTLSLDRKGLLKEIERLHQARGLSEAPAPISRGENHLSGLIQACMDRDPALVARLPEAAVERRLVPLVINLLGDPTLDAAAQAYLGRAGVSAVGAMGDALQDQHAPLGRQLRLVELIADTRCLAAMAHLFSALDEGNATQRLQIGAALLRWRKTDGLPFPPDRAVVVALIEEDLKRTDWLPDSLVPVLELGEHPMLGTHRSVSPRVLQAFTLLALVFDPEPLSLAMRGLSSSDARLHGTATEYLDNVVPRALKRRIIEAL